MTAILLAAISGGFATTYLYDSRATLLTRWAAGTVTGLAALSLTGFLAASILGVGSPAVLVAASLTFSPAATFVFKAHREQLRADFFRGIAAIRARVRRPGAVACAVVGAGALAVLWSIMDRAMIVRPNGIWTGVLHNFGDLPFHLAVVSRFAANNNLPPEHPSFAGVPFTYPFLTDFLSALFVTAGADLRTAIVLPAVLGAGALVLLLHRWTLDLTNDALAAGVAPILMLVGGGLGWWVFLQEAWQAPGNVGALLTRLPHDYTIRQTGPLRFGNVITTLLITQRGINLALPLAVVVFRQWWLAAHDAAGRPNESVRRMLAAGVVAGLLPLIHGHTYMVVVGMAGCLALLFRMWPAWIAFFVVAAGLGLPQLLWLAKGSAVNSASFVGWQFGWDRGETGAVVFWLMNTGALIPIIVWALMARGESRAVPARLRRFYLPFLLCFVVPNVVRLAPWIWDNIKVLVYWFLASIPLVSLVLSRGYRAGGWRRGFAIALFISLTAAGTLDLWRLLSRAAELRVLSQPAIEFARLIASTTESNATVLHAPIHNHSVALSGRRSLMGFPGHVWSQGVDPGAREREIKVIYEGGQDATNLLARYRVDYVVIGPEERRFSKVNDMFFTRYPVVAILGAYRLHRVAPTE